MSTRRFQVDYAAFVTRKISGDGEKTSRSRLLEGTTKGAFFQAKSGMIGTPMVTRCVPPAETTVCSRLLVVVFFQSINSSTLTGGFWSTYFIGCLRTDTFNYHVTGVLFI